MQDPLPSQVRRRLLTGAALGVAAGATARFPQSAWAQPAAWPSRPVRVVVPFPAGSSPDVLARAVTLPLQQALGQPVPVENRAGAGGIIGADLVAKAPADGYTLLMASGSVVVISPHVSPKFPFDAKKDLVPVAAVVRLALFLVVRADLPVKNLDELLAYMRANPGKLSYGSAGTGTSLHLAGEMLKSMANVFAVHIPYRGSAPALQDLLAGQIDFMFDPGISFSHVRAGTLRMLAVGMLHRSSFFPDVPTLDEAGLRGFDAATTTGFYAPAGTPPAVITRLNSEINRAIALPNVNSQLRAIGAEPTPLTPAQFTAQLHDDSRRFAAIVKERNIRAE